MRHERLIKTPIGSLLIQANNEAITRIQFTQHAVDNNHSESPVLLQAETELNEYFAGNRQQFTVAIEPEGTEFQQQVWQELRKVAWGETVSYGEIAKRIKKPNASRAVGMANNKNPIPIIIPCHRVIGANKKLVGYAGGVDVKRKLLSLEGVTVSN